MFISPFTHTWLMLFGLQVAFCNPIDLTRVPAVSPSPRSPSHFQLPCGPPQHGKICIIPKELADAGPAILAAAHECNNGGTILFPPGVNYTISTALDLTFLNNIDFFILGTVYFDDNIDIWPTQTFHYAFQSASLFWRFGGYNVRIYGLGQGTIDGGGQAYWSAMKTNPTVERPILFGTDGLQRSIISGLNMRNPPNWFNLISNSSDILISDMKLTVESLNASAPAKNTDGWDTYRSTRVVIQNSVIVNTDDIVVQNLRCTGSHGISVGSLGQYQGETDIIENLYIYNVSMTNATDVARIKVWPGAAQGSGSTSGGGTGRVRNVVYEHMESRDNDQAISLTQCYGVKDQSLCSTYPSSVLIEDVHFKDFHGSISKKYDPVAGSLVCSISTTCSNIEAQNIFITAPSKQSVTFRCQNIDPAVLGLPCTS